MLWIRIVCLVISLLAATTAATWRLAPVWTRNTVREWERGRQHNYMAGPQGRYDAALKLIAAGKRREATEELLDLCEDLEEIKKKDRLYKLRRRILNRTVSLVELGGDLEGALQLAESLSETDPVDRPALLQVMRLRGILNKDSDQTILEFEQALADLPTCVLTRRELTRHLLALGRVEEALDHELAAIDRNPYELYVGWRVYFRQTGQPGFAGQTVIPQFQPAPQEGVYWCTVSMLQGGVERVRLDPPPHVGMAMADPRVSIDWHGATDVVSEAEPLQLVRMLRSDDGTWLVPGGPDPQIHFAVPPASQAGKSRVVLRIDPKPVLPKDFYPALQDPTSLERMRAHLAGDERGAHRVVLETTLEQLERFTK
jgi:tetratricopeptide (TPR) repeat protein